MSRRKRLNAVATTALVAAFPVFPLFADEPTAPDAAAQTVASADSVKPFEIPNLNEAFADFNVSLFEIPEGESVEFYRKRAAELQAEWFRFVSPYRNRLEAAARANGASKDFNALAFTMFPGTIPTPTGFVKSPADSVPTQYAAALADVLHHLANSSELPPEVRGKYYADWTFVAPSPLGERPLVELRDFYAKLLADEKTKPETNLGRVRYLSERVANIEQRLQTGQGILENLDLPRSFDRADVEKLLAEGTPEGKSAEFYETRVSQLFSAKLRAKEVGEDAAFISRIDRALDAATHYRRLAAKREVAAFDVAAVKKSLAAPQGENAAFYLARFEEAQKIERRLGTYNAAGIGDLNDFRSEFYQEIIPALARRLANADDLSPLERFEYFVRWIYSCDVAELQAALEAETARDATSEIDRARKPFVEYYLLETRLKLAVQEARKDLPEMERYRSTPLETSISPELEATLFELFDEIAERADDGALPWELDETWAGKASYLALLVERVGAEYATRLRKEICAVLADSENETNRRYFGSLENAIRNEELKTRFDGFPVEISGRLLDETPFDWASYRGAPVLIEIVRVDASGVPRNREPLDVSTLDACEKAGLRRVRYVAAPLEIARLFAERVRSVANPTPSDSNAASTETADVANREQYLIYVDDVPVVAPEPRDNWLAKLRADVDWILVAADGKTLAACPKRPKNRDDAPEIGDTLKRLFPHVAKENAK